MSIASQPDSGATIRVDQDPDWAGVYLEVADPDLGEVDIYLSAGAGRDAVRALTAAVEIAEAKQAAWVEAT